MKEGERTAAGILRGIPLYVLYFAHIGTCTSNKNCVMNYVDGTHCNAINSLYYIYMVECAYFLCVGWSCIFH